MGTAMNANLKQVGGDHYKGSAVEHWDFVDQHDLDYFQAQIIKYTMRWREKGGIQDLEKAQHFLDKYMELAKLPTSTVALRFAAAQFAKRAGEAEAAKSKGLSGQKLRAVRRK
jgi:hypothetical protein